MPKPYSSHIQRVHAPHTKTCPICIWCTRYLLFHNRAVLVLDTCMPTFLEHPCFLGNDNQFYKKTSRFLRLPSNQPLHLPNSFKLMSTKLPYSSFLLLTGQWKEHGNLYLRDIILFALDNSIRRIINPSFTKNWFLRLSKYLKLESLRINTVSLCVMRHWCPKLWMK